MTSTNTNRAEHIIARCRQVAACTEVPGETTRTFLSPALRDAHTLLRSWMEPLGMAVHVDAAGNIRALRPAATPNAPRLIIGSHLDTIPNAGAFDGVLGVILGIAIVEQLLDKPLPFAIEVIGFSEEEGVRFSKPFLGSLALIGKLDDEALQRKDRSGITIAQAIQNFSLDPASLPAAVLSAEAFAYLELHIEQGPVLESEDASLGIVESIVGQTRIHLTFTGHANHAGTTPMHLRKDAMAACAEWIVAVEDHAKNQSGLVATVGKVETSPGAGNVIAGLVTATLDVRHANDETRDAAVIHLIDKATQAAAKRGVQLATTTQLEQPAAPMHSHLVDLLQSAAEKAGHPSRRMTSGAGHDAMIIAQRLPSVMLFLRSPNGLSHHPDESVRPQDVEAALTTAMEFLALLRDDRATLKDAHA
jgi:allantoate deiminase